jgi:hypothetical protein
VLTLSDIGPGVVAEDNSETINQMLASYNATVAAGAGSIIGGTGRPVTGPMGQPSSSNGMQSADMSQSSSGCGLSGAPNGTASRSGALAGSVALLALMCSRLRRRARLAHENADHS